MRRQTQRVGPATPPMPCHAAPLANGKTRTWDWLDGVKVPALEKGVHDVVADFLAALPHLCKVVLKIVLHLVFLAVMLSAVLVQAVHKPPEHCMGWGGGGVVQSRSGSQREAAPQGPGSSPEDRPQPPQTASCQSSQPHSPSSTSTAIFKRLPSPCLGTMVRVTGPSPPGLEAWPWFDSCRFSGPARAAFEDP